MIRDTPYDAEATCGAGAAAAAALRRFTEDALRGAGCFAVAGKSPACSVLRSRCKQLGTYDARGYWACSTPANSTPRSSCIIT